MAPPPPSDRLTLVQLLLTTAESLNTASPYKNIKEWMLQKGYWGWLQIDENTGKVRARQRFVSHYATQEDRDRVMERVQNRHGTDDAVWVCYAVD